MNDQELDRILRGLKDEDASHLGSVASSVMSRVEAEARRWRLWPALAAAVAAMIAISLWIPHANDAVERIIAPPLTLPRPPIMARVSHSQAPSAAAPAIRRPPARAAVKAGPLEIRMQTDDPDVLIIWLVDEEEGQQ